MTKNEKRDEAQINDGKIFAILSYLSVLCIIPLLLKKENDFEENDFVLQHGKQGLVLFVGEVAVFIVHIIIPWIWNPGIFVFGVLSFFGIISVLQGRIIKLPFISKIADNITL